MTITHDVVCVDLAKDFQASLGGFLPNECETLDIELYLLQVLGKFDSTSVHQNRCIAPTKVGVQPMLQQIY